MFRELLLRCAAVTENQAAELEAHYELLCRWNRVLNLTRVERLKDAVERHYCESLFLAERMAGGPGLRVADVGSGGGFPGLPIAVVRPEWQVTLIEAHQRKAVFLREASRELKNVFVVDKRAEGVQGRFDWVVSRAVSYRDLAPVVAGSAVRIAVLTGAEEPPVAWGLSWDAFPLPWGRARFLRVSRETRTPCST